MSSELSLCVKIRLNWSCFHVPRGNILDIELIYICGAKEDCALAQTVFAHAENRKIDGLRDSGHG